MAPLLYRKIWYDGNVMMPPMVRRKPESKSTSFRLTVDALSILEELAFRQGVTMTAMLEFLLRQEAERRGITLAALPRPRSEDGD